MTTLTTTGRGTTTGSDPLGLGTGGALAGPDGLVPGMTGTRSTPDRAMMTLLTAPG